jgi:sugar porter (SP) family MFS transporter
MNKKLLKIALIASLGGLLFGFDTAVISGAEQSIKEVYNLDGFWLGFTNSIALIGTIIGTIFCGRPADAFGRKKVLVFLASLYVISALGCAFALSWHMLLFFRLVGGLGVGASSVIGPMYISEIAPAKARGRLVAMFQFNIVFGILLAFFSNYFLNKYLEGDVWRWMLGVQAIPAAVFFGTLFLIPESPRWLILKHRHEDAKKVLNAIDAANAPQLLQDIEASLNPQTHSVNERLFSKKYRFPLMLAAVFATLNQFSGINAIMYYAPRIFQMAGLEKDTALLQVALIGVTNMLFTVLAMFFIDKFGRKTLMIIGSVGMAVSLALTAHSFYLQDFSGYSLLVYLVCFIAFFAFSHGAVIWVFLSEIFPNSVRAKGQAFGSLTHWFWAAALTWTFPMVAEVENGGFYAFAFFAVAMALQLIFVLKVMPETKGKSLEEIEKTVV